MSETVTVQAPLAPPSPGEFGLFLKSKNIDSKPLGNDSIGIEMIELNPDNLVSACKILKENTETDFNFLVLLGSLELKSSFQTIYNLQSLKTKKLLRIKVNVSKEDPTIPSVSGVWSTADWYEREAYDMMGIKFSGHPNLKRILNPDNWEGFPLRKDYIPPTDALNGPHPISEKEMADKTLTKPS